MMSSEPNCGSTSTTAASCTQMRDAKSNKQKETETETDEDFTTSILTALATEALSASFGLGKPMEDSSRGKRGVTAAPAPTPSNTPRTVSNVGFAALIAESEAEARKPTTHSLLPIMGTTKRSVRVMSSDENSNNDKDYGEDDVMLDDEDDDDDEDGEPVTPSRKKAARTGNGRYNQYGELSFLGAAEEVLRREGKPLAVRQILEYMLRDKLISTNGKTPKQTLAARLYSNLKERKPIFKLVDSGIFGLADRHYENEKVMDPITKKPKAMAAKEKKPGASNRKSTTGPKRRKQSSLRHSDSDDEDDDDGDDDAIDDHFSYSYSDSTSELATNEDDDDKHNSIGDELRIEFKKSNSAIMDIDREPISRTPIFTQRRRIIGDNNNNDDDDDDDDEDDEDYVEGGSKSSTSRGGRAAAKRKRNPTSAATTPTSASRTLNNQRRFGFVDNDDNDGISYESDEASSKKAKHNKNAKERDSQISKKGKEPRSATTKLTVQIPIPSIDSKPKSATPKLSSILDNPRFSKRTSRLQSPVSSTGTNSGHNPFDVINTVAATTTVSTSSNTAMESQAIKNEKPQVKESSELQQQHELSHEETILAIMAIGRDVTGDGMAPTTTATTVLSPKSSRVSIKEDVTSQSQTSNNTTLAYDIDNKIAVKVIDNTRKSTDNRKSTNKGRSRRKRSGDDDDDDDDEDYSERMDVDEITGGSNYDDFDEYEEEDVYDENEFELLFGDNSNNNEDDDEDDEAAQLKSRSRKAANSTVAVSTASRPIAARQSASSRTMKATEAAAAKRRAKKAATAAAASTVRSNSQVATATTNRKPSKNGAGSGGSSDNESSLGGANGGLSFTEAAKQILKREGKAMAITDILDIMLKEKLVSTKGKTPRQTLAGRLYSNAKSKNPTFRLVDKGLFELIEDGSQDTANPSTAVSANARLRPSLQITSPLSSPNESPYSFGNNTNKSNSSTPKSTSTTAALKSPVQTRRSTNNSRASSPTSPTASNLSFFPPSDSHTDSKNSNNTDAAASVKRKAFPSSISSIRSVREKRRKDGYTSSNPPTPTTANTPSAAAMFATAAIFDSQSASSSVPVTTMATNDNNVDSSSAPIESQQQQQQQQKQQHSEQSNNASTVTATTAAITPAISVSSLPAIPKLSSASTPSSATKGIANAQPNPAKPPKKSEAKGGQRSRRNAASASWTHIQEMINEERVASIRNVPSPQQQQQQQQQRQRNDEENDLLKQQQQQQQQQQLSAADGSGLSFSFSVLNNNNSSADQLQQRVGSPTAGSILEQLTAQTQYTGMGLNTLTINLANSQTAETAIAQNTQKQQSSNNNSSGNSSNGNAASQEPLSPAPIAPAPPNTSSAQTSVYTMAQNAPFMFPVAQFGPHPYLSQHQQSLSPLYQSTPTQELNMAMLSPTTNSTAAAYQLNMPPPHSINMMAMPGIGIGFPNMLPIHVPSPLSAVGHHSGVGSRGSTTASEDNASIIASLLTAQVSASMSPTATLHSPHLHSHHHTHHHPTVVAPQMAATQRSSQQTNEAAVEAKQFATSQKNSNNSSSVGPLQTAGNSTSHSQQ